MKVNVGISLHLFVLICILASTVPLTREASGTLLPDFDLEVDGSLAWVDPETHIGQFDAIVTNVAIDATIRVQLTVNIPGFLVSPQFATVEVGPGSSKTVPIAVAVLYYSPAQIRNAHVVGEITHVNGSPTSGGKTREIFTAVIFPRFHDVTPSITNISLGRGEVKSEGILFNNSGNIADYIALEFLDEDGSVWAYPQVDYVHVKMGQISEYPIIVRASKKASREVHTIRYRLYPIADPSKAEEGELNIMVLDEESTVNGNGSPGLGMVMGIGIIGLALSMWLSASVRKEGHMSYRGRPTWLATMMVVLLVAVNTTPTAMGFNGEVVVGSSGTVDVSPMTNEELAIHTNMVTLESSDTTEQLVEVLVEAPGALTSYNRLQRVPVGGSTSFEVHTILPKESEMRTLGVSVQAHTIEREGVEIEDGEYVSGGFFVVVAPYSLPFVEPMGDTFVVMKEGDTASFSVDVVNLGNSNDTLNTTLRSIDGSDEPVIPDKDLTLGDRQYEREIIELKVTGKAQVLRLEARGANTDQPIAGCTIVVVPEEEDDETVDLGDPMVIGGIAIGLVVIILAVFFVILPRRKVDEENGEEKGSEDMEEGSHSDTFDNVNWDEGDDR